MSTLVMIPWQTNTGYAITELERLFYAAATRLEGQDSTVHFSYAVLDAEGSATLPRTFTNYVECDYASLVKIDAGGIGRYVREHDISRAIALDLRVGNPVIGHLRDSGVTRLVSYYGAPMGSVNRGLKLWAKRVEVLFRRRADHFVFESEAMRETAVRGRGIPLRVTSVVHLATDQEVFNPVGPRVDRDELGVPQERLLVLFTGHMEPRKGVAVLIRCMIHLVDELGDPRFHLLICGNRGNEAEPYLQMLEGTDARSHVTFGGYRDDIPKVMRAADIGVIASTGWDSFTMSAVEMASSGLPLLVSDLHGLPETIEPGETGFLIPPGDHDELARRLRALADDPELRQRMGRAARARALRLFSREHQVERLARIVAGDPAHY